MKRTSEGAYLRYIFAGAIIFIIFILQYSGLLTFSTGRLTAVLVVPSVVFCAMFMGEIGGSMLGLFMGICLDCVMIRAVCFNALFLMAAGFLCGLFAHYLINRNFLSAMVVSAVANFAYFLLKWLIFTAFSSSSASAIFWKLVLPSMGYTFVVSIPLYFLFSALLRQKAGEVKRV